MKEPYFDYFSEGNLKCFQMFAILNKCYNKYCLYFLPHCSIISLGYSPRGRTARSDAMNLKASDEHIALEKNLHQSTFPTESKYLFSTSTSTSTSEYCAS